jgi:hypothetical protein
MAVVVGCRWHCGSGRSGGKPTQWRLQCALIRPCWGHWPRCTGAAGLGSSAVDCVGGGGDCDGGGGGLSVALKQREERWQATQWQLGYQDLQQLGFDTSPELELVRRLTEAGTAGEGAEQEPQQTAVRFNGFFSPACGWGVAKRRFVNAINPTTHKHAAGACWALFGVVMGLPGTPPGPIVGARDVRWWCLDSIWF